MGILTSILLAAIAIRVVFWIVITAGARISVAHESAEATQTVLDGIQLHVVIAAKNEADNLPSLIEALEAQTFQDFDVWISDDNSSDATADIILKKQEKDSRFHFVSAGDETRTGKKLALSRAIESVPGGRIVLTDADCRPGPEWLKYVALAHERDPSAVWIGQGPLRTSKRLSGYLAHFENIWTGLLVMGAVGLNRPYMAVGRNLSYPKILFERIGGFSHSSEFQSGDDDLFVQEVRRKRIAPIRYLSATESFVVSDGPSSWGEWLQRKRRHFSVGGQYDRVWLFVLALFHASNLVIWMLPIFLGFKVLIAVWLSKWILESVGFQLLSRFFFHENTSILRYPVLDILYVFLQIFWAPISVITKPEKW